MIIAVTAKGRDLDSEMDPRFGRAAYILLVDSQTHKVDVLDNSANVNAFKGAGIQAASDISAAGAAVLLTGYCGPNAFKMLATANIDIYPDASGTVREALAAHQEGQLQRAEKANAEAHW